MLNSYASVATERGPRYLKQLSAHFDHKAESVFDDHHSRTAFGFGVCEMTAEPDTLHFHASADDEEQLARVEYVVSDHLERFAKRDGLTVQWKRGEAT